MFTVHDRGAFLIVLEVAGDLVFKLVLDLVVIREALRGGRDQPCLVRLYTLLCYYNVRKGIFAKTNLRSSF